jgi:hypothetical protein
MAKIRIELKPKEISFYDKDQPYYEFSNFYPSKISIDGTDWLTVEHYYQSQKFNYPQGLEYMRIMSYADTPNKIYKLARQQKGKGYEAKWLINKKLYPVLINQIVDQYADVKIRPDWEQSKNQIMYTALKAKFTQHPRLMKLLMSTGVARIIEASPRDDYWGIGAQGTGQNWLGRLLMTLRVGDTPITPVAP